MKLLRGVAIGFGLIAMSTEAYRSWGVGRPVAFWMDDVLMGTLLIAGAIAVGRPTPARHALFTGAWGVALGMCYISFFEKVFAPQTQNAGNASLGFLTGLTGLGFAVACIGFVASIVAASQSSP